MGGQQWGEMGIVGQKGPSGLRLFLGQRPVVGCAAESCEIAEGGDVLGEGIDRLPGHAPGRRGHGMPFRVRRIQVLQCSLSILQQDLEPGEFDIPVGSQRERLEEHQGAHIPSRPRRGPGAEQGELVGSLGESRLMAGCDPCRERVECLADIGVEAAIQIVCGAVETRSGGERRSMGSASAPTNAATVPLVTRNRVSLTSWPNVRFLGPGRSQGRTRRRGRLWRRYGGHRNDRALIRTGPCSPSTPSSPSMMGRRFPIAALIARCAVFTWRMLVSPTGSEPQAVAEPMRVGIGQ